ncbi:MAG: DHH family phosphoesterase [Clostridia bacterium]|nr:DHH family phosphoesterase [Clostridia bacterium]
MVIDFKGFYKTKKIIDSCKNFAIFIHINPDGDCITSALALSLFLTKYDKNVDIYTPNLTNYNEISTCFYSLPHFNLFNKKSFEGKYDCAIAVDCANFNRLSKVSYELFSSIKNSILIDHHEYDEKVGEFTQNTIRRPEATSTTLIIYHLMKYINRELIDDDIAMLLYTGLMTDSGCLSQQNANVDCFEMALEIVKKYKISISDIVNKYYKEVSIKKFNFTNYVLSHCEYYDNNRIAILKINNADFKKYDCDSRDSEGIVSKILTIDSILVSIVVRTVDINLDDTLNEEIKYKLSFRTKGSINMVPVCKYFDVHGGGHINACGCIVSTNNFDSIKEELIKKVSEEINK